MSDEMWSGVLVRDLHQPTHLELAIGAMEAYGLLPKTSREEPQPERVVPLTLEEQITDRIYAVLGNREMLSVPGIARRIGGNPGLVGKIVRQMAQRHQLTTYQAKGTLKRYRLVR